MPFHTLLIGLIPRKSWPVWTDSGPQCKSCHRWTQVGNNFEDCLVWYCMRDNLARQDHDPFNPTYQIANGIFSSVIALEHFNHQVRSKILWLYDLHWFTVFTTCCGRAHPCPMVQLRFPVKGPHYRSAGHFATLPEGGAVQFPEAQDVGSRRWGDERYLVIPGWLILHLPAVVLHCCFRSYRWISVYIPTNSARLRIPGDCTRTG